MKLLGLKPPPGCPPDSIVTTYAVPREFSGQRLDRFVQNCIPRLSRTRAQQIIRNCGYRPDGSRRRPSDLVREGEIVLLVRETFEEPETPQHFGRVFEDDAMLALDKPAGLPVHPTATYHRNTLTHLLRVNYGNAFTPQIAHRLDRETSGVMIAGKSLDASRKLNAAFEARDVKKTYLAIVRGEMPDDQGVIDLPLSPVKEGLHLLMEVRDEGETSHARTHYLVRGRRNGYSLVELHPHTGRQHQLRVHLSAIGHSIVGDKLYGPEREAPFLEVHRSGMTPEIEARLGHCRHALHAFSIELDHPVTGRRMNIEAPLAPDLQALWQDGPLS